MDIDELNKLNELKTELSKEWNKPKYENLRRNKEGIVIDNRQPRDYNKIKCLQTQIKNLKNGNKNRS